MDLSTRNLKQTGNIELAIVCQERVKEIEKHLIEGVRYYICPITSGFVKRKIKWGGSFKTNDPLAIEGYMKVIDEFKPDVIHIFGTENDYGLITQHTKIPVVIDIQGFLDVWNRKYFSGIPVYEFLSFKSIYMFLKGGGEFNYYLFQKKMEERERIIFAHAPYFLGRTDFDRHVVKTIAPQAKYFQGEEMIRHEFFHEQWNKKPGDTLIISSVIRPAPYKGTDMVFESAEMLDKLGINFSWNIIGTSSNDEIIRLLEKKYKRTFSKKVIFHGGLHAPQIMELLKNSDLYVHPSYIENSPNSVCEAMLLGMPAIVVSSGGCSSMLEHKQEGLLVNAGDPFDLTGTILDLKENPEFAVNLGFNARKRALKRHDPDQIVADLLKTYQIIIDESHK